MKSVLLIGLGRFGIHIARKLNELGHEVMAIDNNEDRINHALPFVTNAQIGDSTDEEFLNTLGVRNFDLCVVTIGESFQSSLETTSLLKDLGASFVVSRATNDIQEKFLLKNGADKVVYPEKELASWTAIRYTSDHIMDYIELDDGYSIFELSIPKSWANKTIGDLDIRKKHNINIMGIKRDKKLYMGITPQTVLDENETILVLGKYKDIQKVFKI